MVKINAYSFIRGVPMMSASLVMSTQPVIELNVAMATETDAVHYIIDTPENSYNPTEKFYTDLKEFEKRISAKRIERYAKFNIIRAEGVGLPGKPWHAYIDPHSGEVHIGSGIVYPANGIRPKLGDITNAEENWINIDFHFQDRLETINKFCTRTNDLNESQMLSWIDCLYRIGGGNFKRSEFLNAWNNGASADIVAKLMMNFNVSGGVQEKGTTARAAINAWCFRGDLDATKIAQNATIGSIGWKTLREIVPGLDENNLRKLPHLTLLQKHKIYKVLGRGKSVLNYVPASVIDEMIADIKATENMTHEQITKYAAEKEARDFATKNNAVLWADAAIIPDKTRIKSEVKIIARRDDDDTDKNTIKMDGEKMTDKNTQKTEREFFERPLSGMSARELVRRGDAKVAFREYAGAADVYRMALLHGKNMITQSKLAKLLMRTGDFDSAHAEFTALYEMASAKKSKQYLAIAQLGMAQIYKSTGNLRQANMFTSYAIKTIAGGRGAKKASNLQSQIENEIKIRDANEAQNRKLAEIARTIPKTDEELESRELEYNLRLAEARRLREIAFYNQEMKQA